jgi:hypothetical protein
MRSHYHSLSAICRSPCAAVYSLLTVCTDYYDRQAGIRRQIARHVGKLGALGFEVTLCRIPEPAEEAGSTPAA